MEIAISLIGLAKVAGAIVAVLFLALVCLWPINDQPTSVMQFIVWITLSVLVVLFIFGKFSISISI